MKLLNRKYSIVWLLLSIITLNISNIFLGKLLKVYDKGAWYTKWYIWVLGILLGIFPGLIMFLIFILQTNVKIACKLEVTGDNIYGYPYVWILSIIVPIIGWSIFIILDIYIYVWIMIRMFQGKGENVN